MSSCPSCHTEVAAGDEFCGSCGVALSPAPRAEVEGSAVAALHCDSCRAVVTAGDEFCGSCGVALAPAVEQLAEGETRVAAAIRCDSCRAEVAAGDEFCGSCGVALSGLPEEVRVPPRRLVGDVWRVAYTPGWLIGALVFAATICLLVWFTAQVLAPAILESTPVEQLQGGIQLITTLMVLCSLAAGLAGGLAGGWQARRNPSKGSRSVLANAVAGPLLVAVGLVVATWLRHDATPLRSTIINLVLVALGSAAGGVALNLGSRTGRPLRRRPIAVSVGALALGALLLAPAATDADSGGGYSDIKPGDCTLTAVERSFQASLTIASIDIGGTFSFRKQETAAKQWGVAVTYGATGGFTVSLGGKLAKAAGLSLNISTSGHVTLIEVNQYAFTSEAEADRMIRWAVGPYLTAAAALPGVGGIVAPALAPDRTQASFKPPHPSSTQVKLGGSVNVEIAALQINTELELGDAVSIELSNDPKETSEDPLSNPEEVVLGFDLEALASGTVGGAALGLNGDGEMTVAFKKESVVGFHPWYPSDLELGATAQASGKLGGDFGGLWHDITFLKPLGLSVEGRTGATLAADLSVDLPTHPGTLAALAGYVGALAPAFAGKPLNDAAVSTAGDALATSFATNADVGVTLVENTDVQGNLDVSMGDGLTFGVSATAGQSNETLLLAWYRDQVSHVAPSLTCRPTNSSA